MQLPIFRQLTYVSPSMFLKWRACQFKVYLSRLAGHTYPESERSMAASIGTAFDAFVKDYIAKKRGISSPVLKLDSLLKGLSKESCDKGRIIAKAYIDSGWIKIFLEAKECRLEQEMFSNFGGVPILGRLDAIIDDEAFDWKTRGTASAYPIYPTKGWGERYEYDLDTMTGKKICPEDGQTIPLEERNADWAVGQLFYNWLLHGPPYKFHIHEIVQQGNRLIFVNHKHIITKEFAAKIQHELGTMWEEINGQLYYANIDEPQPRKQICESYGQLCEVAQFCTKYMDTLGDPERRINYV